MKSLFLIRHHNDFDSITPVIDSWVRLSDSHHALVFFAGPAVKWRGDFRTELLRETGKVSFGDIWGLAGAKEDGMLARGWQANLPDHRIRRKLLQLATEIAVAPKYSSRMIDLVDRFAPDIIAFDHNAPTSRKFLGFFGYEEALHWRNKHGIPLVSLPHGLLLFDEPGNRSLGDDTRYDAIFVESERKKQLYRPDAQDSIFVSGAPRYDREWVERIAGHFKKARRHRGSDAVRIVFFATKAKGYYKFGQLLDWLELLAARSDVELVIQPHPRGQKTSDFSRLRHLPRIVVDSKTPASKLIGSADIVSTLVSSVVVEAAIRGREILYPAFLNRVETRFNETGACISLASQEDTDAAIDAFRAGNRVPVEAYDRFLTEFVWGGADGKTISRVCAHMHKLAVSARK